MIVNAKIARRLSHVLNIAHTIRVVDPVAMVCYHRLEDGYSAA